MGREILRDKDIREPLYLFLEETFGKMRIIEEKNTGKARADAVMILPDSICGIEIKSDADTYARLKKQVREYDKYYDMNYVVVGSSHAKHVSEHVKDYWGIIVAEQTDDVINFTIQREPQINPKVTWIRKLGILWRPELVVLQELNEMPRYKEKSKDFVVEKIVERLENGKISEDTLKVQVSDILFERDYTLIAEEIKKYRVESGRAKPRKPRTKRRRRARRVV